MHVHHHNFHHHLTALLSFTVRTFGGCIFLRLASSTVLQYKVSGSRLYHLLWITNYIHTNKSSKCFWRTMTSMITHTKKMIEWRLEGLCLWIKMERIVCLLWLSNDWAETIFKHPYSILFLRILSTCHNNSRQITIMREHMAFEECQHQGDSMTYRVLWGEMGASLMAQMVKHLPAMQETWVQSIPGLGRSPGEENGNLLQYSCLENSTNRGAW